MCYQGKKSKFSDELKEKDEKLRLFMKENEKLAKDIREIRSYAEKKYDGKTKDIPMSSLVGLIFYFPFCFNDKLKTS